MVRKLLYFLLFLNLYYAAGQDVKQTMELNGNPVERLIFEIQPQDQAPKG